jgi:hypothetical protein
MVYYILELVRGITEKVIITNLPVRSLFYGIML